MLELIEQFVAEDDVPVEEFFSDRGVPPEALLGCCLGLAVRTDHAAWEHGVRILGEVNEDQGLCDASHSNWIQGAKGWVDALGVVGVLEGLFVEVERERHDVLIDALFEIYKRYSRNRLSLAEWEQVGRRLAELHGHPELLERMAAYQAQYGK